MNIEGREKSGYFIIDIAGRINKLKDSIALKTFIKGLLEKNIVRIALNLQDVTYLDSGALNVLIYCHNTLSKNDGELVLIAPNRYVYDVLTVVGLDKIVKITASEEDLDHDPVSSA